MRVGLWVAFAALGLPVSAVSADLTGTWMLNGDFGSGLKYKLICVLQSNAQDVSGPCVAVPGASLRTSGRWDGRRMEFTYRSDYNGSGYRSDFDGAMTAGGAVQGSVSTQSSHGQFTATPLMDQIPDRPRPWKVDVAFPGVSYSAVCAFKTSGGGLNGPCAITEGPTLQVQGSSDKSDVTLSYDTEFQNRPVHLVYSGEVQADGSIKGTARSGDGAGTFTAARQ